MTYPFAVDSVCLQCRVMFFSQPVLHDPVAQADELRRWRAGRIRMQKGVLEGVSRRRFAASISVAEVWWRAKYGRPRGDFCYLDYHQPWGMPGFLTLDYVHSGEGASYKTFVGACRVLDDIAQLRGAQAIVAHVTNASISDRLLHRLGWERHLESWSGRHWIRRFYDGYPEFSAAAFDR
ncbi:MAG: hypothetical protein AAGA03_05015 [Planctomycetota bacterium]